MPRLASSLARSRVLISISRRQRRFVQIDLPVHQAAGSEEVLNRIDAFGLYYQVVILYIQHLDNAGGANVAFGHSGIEAVAAQVVQAVHIQLPAYQLVQEALGVFILEI